MKAEIPYLSDNGTPIFMIAEGAQRSYFGDLTGEETTAVLQAAAELGNVIRTFQVERTQCKEDARNLMRIPEGSTAEFKTERMKKLEDIKKYYDALAEHIQALKATVYTKENGAVTIPRVPKAPVKPK